MRPYIIGICGGSGSGKTTFIKQLRAAFAENEVCFVSLDDYYLPRDQQHRDVNNQHNFDLPKSFDKKAFRRDVERLVSGETVNRPEYTFNNPDVTPKMLTFRPAPVLILEGLFVFHFKKIAPLLNLKVFIDTKENLKVIRRIFRDQVERGYPIEDVLYKYQHHVMPSFERYILPYKDQADIVINNNAHFEEGMKLIEAFIRTKIRG